MDVLVLLEARRGGEGLATLRTCVSACTHVLGTDVALEVAGVCEHLEFETSAHSNCHVRRHQQRLFELKFSVQFQLLFFFPPLFWKCCSFKNDLIYVQCGSKV